MNLTNISLLTGKDIVFNYCEEEQNLTITENK